MREGRNSRASETWAPRRADRRRPSHNYLHTTPAAPFARPAHLDGRPVVARERELVLIPNVRVVVQVADDLGPRIRLRQVRRCGPKVDGHTRGNELSPDSETGRQAAAYVQSKNPARSAYEINETLGSYSAMALTWCRTVPVECRAHAAGIFESTNSFDWLANGILRILY